jgi:hypothetical protein
MNSSSSLCFFKLSPQALLKKWKSGHPAGQEAYFIALYLWCAQIARAASRTLRRCLCPGIRNLTALQYSSSGFANRRLASGIFPSPLPHGRPASKGRQQQGFTAYTVALYGYAVIEFFFLLHPLYTPIE